MMPESITVSSGGETETTIGFPAIENREFRSNSGHTIGGGVIWGENEDWVLSAVVTVMTMLRMKTGLIFVILHVDNGGF